MKREIPITKAGRLLNSGCVTLVTSANETKRNVLTVAWQSPVSHTPLLVSIAVAKTHYSHELISESGEFVINIPSVSMLESVHQVGSLSGRNGDKFDKSGLTVTTSNTVKPVTIQECIGHLECVVEQAVSAGDHTLFISRVTHASADDEFFDLAKSVWNVMGEEFLLHHLGGTFYTGTTTLYKI
jgi:flavin reductase (DIM6/NTAB) family NADH-FMN oxidoreductase RutF